MGHHDRDHRSSGHRPSTGRNSTQPHVCTTCSASESYSMGTLYSQFRSSRYRLPLFSYSPIASGGPHCRPIRSPTFGTVPPVMYPNPLINYLPASYKPLPIPPRPWSHIAIDLSRIYRYQGGHTTILTVVDRFSKACRFIPLPKLPTALETAESLCNYVFRFYGLPEDIVSDRGPHSPPESGLPSVKNSISMSASHPVTILSPMVKWNA